MFFADWWEGTGTCAGTVLFNSDKFSLSPYVQAQVHSLVFYDKPTHVFDYSSAVQLTAGIQIKWTMKSKVDCDFSGELTKISFGKTIPIYKAFAISVIVYPSVQVTYTAEKQIAQSTIFRDGLMTGMRKFRLIDVY